MEGGLEKPGSPLFKVLVDIRIHFLENRKVNLRLRGGRRY
jgi:hypothetical protein